MSAASRLTLVFALSLGVPTLAHAGAAPECPDIVTGAAKNAFPDAALLKCRVRGNAFEAKMKKVDKSIVELDITPKGEIIQIEEIVKIAELPEPVTKAFTERYPKGKITRAEKMTMADKSVSFELAFRSPRGRKEATFKSDGTFVEEE